MTTRTHRTWRSRPPGEEPPRIGRPPHTQRMLRHALRDVRRQMKRQGKSVGEGAVLAALNGKVPTRLVRQALSRWKARDRRSARERVYALRVSIVPVSPGVMASMDVAQLGRLFDAHGVAVKVAQVVDVDSGVTCAAHVGVRMGGAEIVAMLERLCVRSGDAPLVLAHDGGSENVNADVAAWAQKWRVILLRSVPHTPQHNPWAEKKHGDMRGVSDLRSDTVLSSIAEGTSRFDTAVRVLDHGRLRRRNGWRTAAERDRGRRVRYSPERREALWKAVRAAEEEAMRSCVSARDRPRAVREAKLRVLKEYGVLFRTRGGVPDRRGEAEIIS
ncbi:MAG: DDE-type integrase/transposase/recombinase [Planctomycetes bacterium]|nr:DDE-type integrase/transposase/recombinase [Planctomycetota bacterium]